MSEELQEELLSLRTKFNNLFGEHPLPIKSTVGMVLDGMAVSMTIPGYRILIFQIEFGLWTSE